MQDIPYINIRDLSVPTVPRWAIESPIAVLTYPPVTSQVGLPIVNMPHVWSRMKIVIRMLIYPTMIQIR